MRQDQYLRSTIKCHEQSITAMKMNKKGDYLLTADKTGFIKYFHTTILVENELVVKATDTDKLRHKDAIRDIAFSPNDEKFITCSEDKTLRVGDLESGRYEKVFEGHGSDVTTVDWHPYYSLTASGGKDRFIKVWDVKSGQEICSLYKHTNSLSKIRFCDDGRYMVSCGRDQMLKIFDVRTMKVLHEYKGHDSDIFSVNWNPSIPTMFASCDQSGKICLWDINQTKPLTSWLHSSIAVGQVEVWELAWNKLGNMLATCGGDKHVKLWMPNDLMQLPQQQQQMSFGNFAMPYPQSIRS